MKELNRIVEHLTRIAKANGDVFKFRIDIEPYNKEIQYYFVVEESTDDHTFIYFKVDNINNIPNVVTIQAIIDACKHWGYEYVD